jgi:hypothetical protein
MKEFKDYEGVVCKNRKELKSLATMADEKGYKVCCFFHKRPKYGHFVFLEGWFYDCEDWFIKFKLTKEEFLERIG